MPRKEIIHPYRTPQSGTGVSPVFHHYAYYATSSSPRSPKAIDSMYTYDALRTPQTYDTTHPTHHAYHTTRKPPDCNHLALSPKHQCGKSQLYYYGYRFYNPDLGRWINRDPIGERGGVNLFAFIHNSSILFIDAYGLQYRVAPGLGGGVIDRPIDPLPGGPIDVIPDALELFIRYLVRNGDEFDGYSDAVWEGIFEHDEVELYENNLESKALQYRKCCEEYEVEIPGYQLTDNESFFNFHLKTLPVAVAIGSGSLNVEASSMTVECGVDSCEWTVETKFTVKDKYTFKHRDEDGNVLPFWSRDNNRFLRIMGRLDLWGKEFDTSDSRKREFSGSHDCVD